ncbi:SWIB/MDM2 domain superfamily protein [Perilla frutescens var. hirtella]|uniref:SWIB/MDM2 domain superfamily protein n=1 Tax=Perilla frutescens var. hirtella TaxID=608512 RepID=A0AAD4P5H3_PERFH|nr:SWIB/MDM2 domain superfamily protein [Perilla frutescens var. frutescens]KAH6793772.1 SWIB/MDM2 domain superfamily protein [Perilla frutescens var. hirtella]KAH6827006.1 SWIB/MDM2 domain superfamily protein [Perilla frutescens var. hirtella]
MSTASGLLRGTRALLAAARSSAASAPKPIPASPSKKVSAAAAAAPAKSTKPPKKKKTSNAESGIMKSKPISMALQDFVGEPEISRVEAVKKLWAHIKLNNLQNPADKREIFCDDKLKKLFDGKEKVGFLEIGKLLSSHFVKTA